MRSRRRLGRHNKASLVSSLRWSRRSRPLMLMMMAQDSPLFVTKTRPTQLTTLVFFAPVKAQQTDDDGVHDNAAARLRSAEAASRSTSFRTPPLKPSSFQTTAPLPQITMAPGMKGERWNRLLPSSILTHPILRIDRPSCHPFSSSIIHPHHPTLPTPPLPG